MLFEQQTFANHEMSDSVAFRIGDDLFHIANVFFVRE